MIRADFTSIRRCAASLCLFVLGASLCQSALAQSTRPDLGGAIPNRGGIQAQTLLAKPGMQARVQRMSMKDAISLAEDRHGGRAVGAKRHFSHGQAMQYRVRLLREDGKVKTVVVP